MKKVDHKVCKLNKFSRPPFVPNRDIDPNTCHPTRPEFQLRYDQLCPFCQKGIALYNADLNLYCPVCGKVQVDEFT